MKDTSMGRQSRRKREARQSSIGAIERERLFRLYSTNLSAYFPQFAGQFACPLCLQMFQHTALSSDEITLEHCIPRKLGGKLLTLTCKECNNTHGSKLDAHLVAWLEYDDHVKGLSGKAYKATVIIGDAQLPALLTNDGKGKGIRLNTESRRSDPKQIRKAESYMAGLPSDEMALKFIVKTGLKDQLFSAGLLRCAFLTMFHWFGYGYVLSQPAHWLRDTMLLAMSEKTEFKPRFPDVTDHSRSFNIHIVVYPPQLRCFIVPIPLSTQHSSRSYGVIVPGFDEDTATLYERWEAVDTFEEFNACKLVKLIRHLEVLTDPLNTATPNQIYSSILDRHC